MRRILLFLLLGIGLATAIGFGWALRHGEIPPLPEAPIRDEDMVSRGEDLAQLGGCQSCHGEDLSGGAALETPFGTIFVTNITPDVDTGIGMWSAEAFRRAMRHGVDREGR
jgi:mono/diheme cytochrome c family protein